MAPVEPIYISSDEEGRGMRKSSSRKRQGLQDRAPKPKPRAESADLTRRAHIEPTRRSGSAPGMFTVPSASISTTGPRSSPPGKCLTPKTRSRPTVTPSTVTETTELLSKPARTPDPDPFIQSLRIPDTCTVVPSENVPVNSEDDMGNVQTSASPAMADATSVLDLYPPIEPLHFPERYAVAPVDKAADLVNGSNSGNSPTPTVGSSLLNGPNGSANSRLPNSFMHLRNPEATDITSEPLNSKRKLSESGVGPQKRAKVLPVPYQPYTRTIEYSERGNAHSPAHLSSQMQWPPVLSAFPRAPLNTSNPNLWAIPAHDARMDNSPAVPPRSSLAQTSTPDRTGTPGSAAPATTERKTPQPGQRKRAKRWNCGILADMGTELQRCFSAQAFADKHDMNVKDVHKVFAIYVHKPLFAFAVRGQSRAKMKEFNETLREYDKREKEKSGSGRDNPTNIVKSKKAVADRSKRQEQANS